MRSPSVARRLCRRARATGGAQPKLTLRWAAIGFVFFLLAAAIRIPLPAAIAWMFGEWSLFDFASASMWITIPLLVLGASFLDDWLHRAMHRSNWLWKWVHQMHHSAERVDLAGFRYGHPLEHVLGRRSR